MQQFRADLHIHSRFSRATSSRLNARHLAAWAAVKGIDVLGTGDFTHPQWLAELREQLVRDDASGLYRLRDPRGLSDELPAFADRVKQSRCLFVPQAEISSIYKRGGKVRKVHNIVYMPDFDAVDRLNRKLAEVGNLVSDGRPILGLDARDLLGMVLDADPRGVLVPAHIWTPWFAVFGSKSGFDTLDDCFGDLTGEIFALETGLSSDPEMNWLWSHLDRFALISNSDAHSGDNLGREANLFEGEMSYDGIFRSLRGDAVDCRFLGTLEFFPEEGKYHLDGHRACNVVYEPRETVARGGLCPVCGKPLTVGVLHRVLELADRDTPEQVAGRQGFRSLIPLPEILGEILGVGAKSRKVADWTGRLVQRFGPELAILQDVSLDALRRYWEPLGEGIARMRRGEVLRQGGYDGEYGVVRVFTERERASLRGGGGSKAALPLLDLGGAASAPAVHDTPGRKKTGTKNAGAGGIISPAVAGADVVTSAKASGGRAASASEAGGANASAETTTPHDTTAVRQTSADGGGEGPGLASLFTSARPAEPPVDFNPEQRSAIAGGPGPVLVLAGPGTGKTRTLVGRVQRLVAEGVAARRIVAVTFTRRAATEMDERLSVALGDGAPLPRTDTLHALAFEFWHRSSAQPPVLLSEEAARRVFAEANPDATAQTLREAWDELAVCRERMQVCSLALAPLLDRYVQQKAAWNLADYTDLLEFWLEQIHNGLYVPPWRHVLVDEIQDLSPLQLALVRALLPPGGEGFFGIGDPDQSIYGFRGAHGDVKGALDEAWPGLSVVTLRANYRSSASVLDAAGALMEGRSACGRLRAVRDLPADIRLFEAPSAESEAAWIGDRIRSLIGSTAHTLVDAAPEGALPGEGTFGPGDIAVLVRVRALIPVLQRTLSRLGVPVAAPETEAFWADQRVSLILAAAGRFVGIGSAVAGGPGDEVNCPDKMLARGPLGVAAYLRESPPFDELFWQSAAFKALSKAYDTHGGWVGLINWVNLQSELETVRRRSEKVQVMSLHAAKGLEFRAVFLPALEDGILPFAGAATLSGHADREHMRTDLEEERRLFYVGITRAAEGLYLSRASRRTLYGREVRLKASRFLDDVPVAGVKRSALVRHSKHSVKQLSLLGGGD